MVNIDGSTITILVNVIGIIVIGWRVEHRMTRMETLYETILSECPYCNRTGELINA